MAHHHHPPSPSGSGSSHRRRLSDLLGEQQEPFYLDLYLLEKGCSPAFLDATACGGGGGSCSTCWPRSRRTGGTLLPGRPAARCKKRRGVLRLLLSRILSGATTTTAPAPAKKTKKKRWQQQQPASIGWRDADADHEKPAPPPGGSEDDGPFTTPHALERQQRVEADDEECEKEDDGDGEDEEEDESSKKQQLSPVSVLEQRLFEHSPPPPRHAQNAAEAFVLFSELVLEASCKPTTLLSLLANAKQLRNSFKHGRRSADGGSGGSTRAPPTPPRRFWKKKKNRSHAHRAEEDTLMMPLESDLATATALVASELGGARVRPSDVGPEREDVAGDVAAAVLDALTEEAAAELMMMMMTTTVTRMGQPWTMCG